MNRNIQVELAGAQHRANAGVVIALDRVYQVDPAFA